MKAYLLPVSGIGYLLDSDGKLLKIDSEGFISECIETIEAINREISESHRCIFLEHENPSNVILELSREHICETVDSLILAVFSASVSCGTKALLLSEIEEKMQHPDFESSRVFRRFYSIPFPRLEFLKEVILICESSGFPTVELHLRNLIDSQPAIKMLNETWNDIPERAFTKNRGKAVVFESLVERGISKAICWLLQNSKFTHSSLVRALSEHNYFVPPGETWVSLWASLKSSSVGQTVKLRQSTSKRAVNGGLGKVYLSDSGSGLRVFASVPIEPQEVIVYLTGRIINFEDSVDLPGGEHSVQIGRDVYVDPLSPVRHMNHSCNPNSGFVDEIRLVAIRRILPGEEICYDYSTTMLERFWELDCQCGFKECRGSIRDFDLLPPARQSYYLQLGVVQNFIVEELRLNQDSDLTERFLRRAS